MSEQTKATAHILYTDACQDRPEVICDSNGQVVLDLCKVCGKAEIELLDHPVCLGNSGVAAVPASCKPADATAQEWAAAVRLTFATARSISSLQGIPSHWLDAMRDAALAARL